MKIDKAALQDVPALEKLVNMAYRGEVSRNGWTTEADLLKGDIRTDAESIIALINQPDTVILKYCNDKNEIEGCVLLEKHGNKIYLGMFSVLPELQGKGIGKILLKAADAYALEQNCNSIYMTVISARKELIAWYNKYGYLPTGEKKPFEVDLKYGIPTQPLEFIVLEKTI
jgi:GNAT superfamily N-acetyltransferase